MKMGTYKLGLLMIDYPLYAKNLSGIEKEMIKGNIAIPNVAFVHDMVAPMSWMDGIRVLDLSTFFNEHYDYLIVSVNHKELGPIQESLESKFDISKIFSIEIFSIIDFDFCDYVRLINSNVSIISQNCWGGMVYSQLHHRFLTPTINLFFETDDGFTRFVCDLKQYLDVELIDDGTSTQHDVGEYPVGRLEDIRIHFLHYKSFAEAKDKWDERKKRINWDNILAVMRTENKEAAEIFASRCNYRKIIFTPCDFGLRDQISLEPLMNIQEGLTFGDYLNMSAYSVFHAYDSIRILNGDQDYLHIM